MKGRISKPPCAEFCARRAGKFARKAAHFQRHTHARLRHAKNLFALENKRKEETGRLCRERFAGALDVFAWYALLSAQLGEVLDGANHLAGVAVLVVVPGHDLHLVGVEAAKWLHIRVFASLNVGFSVRLCRKRLPYLATDCFQNYNESVSYSLE